MRYLILFFGLMINTVFAATIPKTVLPIQTWTTNNGAKVYFVSSHELPIIDIKITFDAGSSRDNSLFGLAYLTSQMLNQGSTQSSANQIAAKFDNVGALFSASTERDMTGISLRCLTDPKVLNITTQTLVETIALPDFPKKEFRQQKKQMSNMLQQLQQSPDYLTAESFYQTIYRDNPYGHPVLGTQNSISKISRKDLNRFHEKYYVASNAVIAIVGDLNRQQAEQLAEQLTKQLPKGQPAEPLAAAPELKETIVQHVHYPVTQTHIRIGQIGIGPNDPDYFPLLVGNFILGGNPLVSRLGEEIRQKHAFSYSVYSHFALLSERGFFVIQLQTKNAQASEATKVVLKTLKEFLQEGPSQKELIAAKSNLIGSFPLRLNGNNKIANALAGIGFYHRPLDYLDTYRARVDAVTIPQIREAFKRHIDPDKLAIVTTGSRPAAL